MNLRPFAALLAAALIATGTAAAYEQNEGQVLERDGVRLLVAAQKNGGRGALIGGELRIGKGGCLGLAMGRTVSAVVWPAGTRLLSDQRGVVVPLVGPIYLGESIRAGGGYGHPPLGGGEPEIPPDCLVPRAEVAVIDYGIQRATVY